MMKFELYILYVILIASHVLCERKRLKPTIIEHPNNAYGLSLQRVVLRCQAEGEPTPTIQWYKGGNMVESYKEKPVTSNRHVNGNELLFLHLDTQDEGVYQCNASNIAGWVLSHNASVRIAYLNKNISGPGSRVASVGETVSLECRTPSGVPEPRILWRFNGRLLVEPNKRVKVMSNGALRIDQLGRSDSGRYSCLAKNFAYERESEPGSLIVREKPRFRVAPSNVEVRANEVAVLSCAVDGDPRPAIVWRRDNGRQIASGRASLVEDRGLRIMRVQASDAGNYVCVASNSAGTIEAVARLTVVHGPSFLETPDNSEARVGDKVTLVCVVSGSPRPSVMWAHNGEHYINGDDDGEQQRDDNGERVRVNSVARLVRERVRRNVISRRMRGSGKKNGEWVKWSENGEKINDRVRVRRTGSGQRIGSTNYDNNKYRANSGGRVIVNKDGSLVISPVKIADAGKYECRASSYSGTIQSSAILTVIDSRHDRPPVIDIGPQNQTLRVGLTATFNCQPQQPYDDVSIVWLKDSQRMNAISDPRVIQLTSGTLKINGLRASDAGNYTCRIERGQVHSSWSVTLRVLDKNDRETAIVQTTDDSRMFPMIPSRLEVMDRDESSVTLRWDTVIHDPSETSAIISHYVVQYSPRESPRAWNEMATFIGSPGKVEHLRPNTGYRFLIRSVNELAVGRAFVVPFVVFTTKKQSYSQLSYIDLRAKLEQVVCDGVRVKSVARDTVTLVWQTRASGRTLATTRLLLSGYLVLYRRVPLTRCLANHHARGDLSMMEHCSLSDSALSQLHSEMGREDGGTEHTKIVPIADDYDDRASATTTITSYTIITALTPFRCYDMSVRPYVDHAKYGRLTGAPSKAHTVLTYDSVPGKAPSDLSARWISNSSVDISWQPVSPPYINGILKGYSLHIIGNDTNTTRSIEVSPKSTTVRVKDLVQHIPYIVHIAASTCQGEGIRSGGLVLIASSDVITMSPNTYVTRSGAEAKKSKQIHVAKQPWFIIIMVVAGCVWLIISVFLLVLCRGMYMRGLIYKSGYSNGTKLISNGDSQILSGSSNARLGVGHPNIYNESNNSVPYKDTLILQPLIGTTNTGPVNESKKDNVPDNAIHSMSANYNSGSVNNPRRFQDSVSSNSTTSMNSSNQPRVNNYCSISANNVAPYASASLLQQVIGISTKNNIKNYNFHINNSATHGKILMPFSDSNVTSINQDIPNSQSYPLTAMDWAMNLPNKSDKFRPAIMLNLGHGIPPPPEFPPPPAPISPTASNCTYYLQQDPTADDGTCSYASCPINVPISSASTTLSPVPGYLWSAKHNGLVPVPGYIDYSCIPYHMIAMTRNSDTGSIASSFALPPPHEMLQMIHFPDNLYTPVPLDSQMTQAGLPSEAMSLMISSHVSNGSNITVPHSSGSAGSATMSGGSSLEYSKYDGVGHKEECNSALEDDDGDGDIREDDCEREDMRRCQQSVNGWQSPQSRNVHCIHPLTTHGSSVPQRVAPYFTQTHYHPIEEATYDTCAEDHHPLFQSQKYLPPNLSHHKDFFPPPPNGGYYGSNHFNDTITNCYDNPPIGHLNSTTINPFLGCGYLEETPII